MGWGRDLAKEGDVVGGGGGMTEEEEEEGRTMPPRA